MSQRDRRSALRAVQAAAEDASGKLGVAADLPPTLTAVAAPAPEPEPAPEPVAEAAPPTKPRQAAAKAKPAQDPELESLLPDEWRAKVETAKSAESVEVYGEKVRRRVDEEMVYLAVRVPRSLRDAVRKRADRLDVSIQDFVVRANQMLLEATVRAGEE